MRWFAADIVEAVAKGLAQHAEAENAEQAVYGLDCLDELQLHPIIAQSLRQTGYGIWPEQRYPDDWHLANQAQGKRCDLVLTPNANSQGLREQNIIGTLFDTPDLTDPEQAYWLEIKTVAQFETSGPFKRYSAELLSPVAADVKKLHADSHIFHAGLLLVLFTQTKEVAEHDLHAWHDKCLDRGYPIATGATRTFEITDRIGNGCCAVSLFGVGR